MTLQCRVVPMGMKSSKVPLREISREHPQEDIMKLALELFEMRRRPEERPFQERFRVLWYNTKLKGYISFDDEPITPESTPKDCIECLIEPKPILTTPLCLQSFCPSKEECFGIGVLRGKRMHSYRVLKSTAVNLGASFCFTIGARYNVSSLSDDDKLPIPMYHYTDWTDFLLHSPIPSPIVAAEFGGISLCDYSHPKRCSYLIGSEEFGIDAHILEYCTSRVTLPARRAESFSISAVAPPLLTDRTMKQHTGKTMKRRRAD